MRRRSVRVDSISLPALEMITCVEDNGTTSIRTVPKTTAEFVSCSWYTLILLHNLALFKTGLSACCTGPLEAAVRKAGVNIHFLLLVPNSYLIDIPGCRELT